MNEFLQSHLCYDLMPVSGRQLALDADLPVKKAYLALLQHDTEVAPVWSRAKEDSPAEFVGVLTTHNFLLLLQKLYKDSVGTSEGQATRPSIDQVLESLDDVNVADLLAFNGGDGGQTLKRRPGYSFISPEQSLLEAAHVLVSDQTHTLILSDLADQDKTAVDTTSKMQFMSVLSTFYSYRLVQFIASNVCQVSNVLMSQYTNVNTLNSGIADIGTHGDLITASPSKTVIEIIELFIKHRIHAIPIVDTNGHLLDVFERSDIMKWIFDGLSSESLLDCTVEDLLSGVSTSARMHVCSVSATCSDVLNAVRENNAYPVYRFFVTEADSKGGHKLKGVVSVLDLLAEFCHKKH